MGRWKRSAVRAGMVPGKFVVSEIDPDTFHCWSCRAFLFEWSWKCKGCGSEFCVSCLTDDLCDVCLDFEDEDDQESEPFDSTLDLQREDALGADSDGSEP